MDALRVMEWITGLLCDMGVEFRKVYPSVHFIITLSSLNSASTDPVPTAIPS